jgi:isopentenyl-diphosphate Delta-isomerase
MSISKRPSTEMVTLCNSRGEAIGVAPKAEVHHAETPLHLAFSVYIFDHNNTLLVTRRALHKITWPGVLTNSCCGHPRPGEPLQKAIERRVQDELRVWVQDIRLVIPEFAYHAIMSNGIAEYELCPVFTARCERQNILPDPSEVDAYEWVDWQQFAGSVIGERLEVSPWCVEQVKQLSVLGRDPALWPAADDLRLPEAARSDFKALSGLDGDL